MYHNADVLPAGVMQLHEKFCAVAVYSVGKLTHRLYVIIVGHCQLIERRRTVVVVDAGDFGDDKPRAALGALLVIIHKHFRGFPGRLAEAHHHRGHNYTVLDFAAAYLHRRKQHFVFHHILP